MKFTADIKDLRRVVALLRKAQRGSLPLAGIKAEVTGESVELTSADETLTIRTNMTGGKEDGVVVLPTVLLADVLQAAGGEVTLVVAGKDLTVSDEGGKWELECPVSPEEYPVVTELPKRWNTLPDDFPAAVAQVLPAASGDWARPILVGVLMDAEGDGFRLAATDSYRLAVRDVAGTAPKKPLLIPAWLLRHVAKATYVRYAVVGQHVHFEVDQPSWTDAVVYSARLIEGDYPNYRKLLKMADDPVTTLSRQDVLDALARTKPLWVDPAPVQLDLSAPTISVDTSRGRTKVPLDAKPAEAPRVRLNPRFIQDGIKACGDAIEASVHDPMKAVLFRSGAFQYLLMPIRES